MGLPAESAATLSVSGGRIIDDVTLTVGKSCLAPARA